jgi:hypothetical protein
MEYQLENGQVDVYPAGWAIELEDLSPGEAQGGHGG